MLYRAEVKVVLKPGVLDPQGRTVENAVKTLGYEGVSQVRIGKCIALTVEAASQEQAAALVEELGRRVLSNPVLETFTYSLTAQTGVR